MHRIRQRRGKEIGAPRKRFENSEDSFWQRVDKNGPLPLPHTLAALRGIQDPCWVWTGALIVHQKYGEIKVGNKTTYTHRYSLELAGVELIEELEVDHLCELTACCNPNHLEQVTHDENVRRAIESLERRS
jgi:hypothetical protein